MAGKGPIYDIREMEAELFPEKTKRNPLVLVGKYRCASGGGQSRRKRIRSLLEEY